MPLRAMPTTRNVVMFLASTGLPPQLATTTNSTSAATMTAITALGETLSDMFPPELRSGCGWIREVGSGPAGPDPSRPWVLLDLGGLDHGVEGHLADVLRLAVELAGCGGLHPLEAAGPHLEDDHAVREAALRVLGTHPAVGVERVDAGEGLEEAGPRDGVGAIGLHDLVDRVLHQDRRLPGLGAPGHR